MIVFKTGQELIAEQLYEIAFIDNSIPLLYQDDFIVTDDLNQKRTEYYKDIILKGYFKAAYHDGKLVGFHAIKLMEQDVIFAHIATFWVHSDHQRTGIGRQLKMQGEEWARTMNCRYIQTSVHLNNPRMLEINEKAGYKVISQIMQKTL